MPTWAHVRVCAVGLLLLLTSVSAVAEVLHATVIAVFDGNEFVAKTSDKQQHHIQITGIDAPELAQPFAHTSRRYLAASILHRAVTLDCYGTDPYKRRVCSVRMNGEDVGLAQLKAGLAWYAKDNNEGQTRRERSVYVNAQRNAEFAWVGLWAEDQPESPWDWRRRRERSRADFVKEE